MSGERDVHGGTRSRAKNDLVPARRNDTAGAIHRVSPYGGSPPVSGPYVQRKRAVTPTSGAVSPATPQNNPNRDKSIALFRARNEELEGRVRALEEKNALLEEKKKISMATRRQMVNEVESLKRKLQRRDDDVRELERELADTQAALRQAKFDQGGDLLLKKEVKALEAYIKIHEPVGVPADVITQDKKKNPLLEARDLEIRRLRKELESAHRAVELLEREVERYAGAAEVTRARLKSEQEWRRDREQISEIEDNHILEMGRLAVTSSPSLKLTY